MRDLIDDFDRTWSRFRADSLVTRIAHARHGGRFELPDHAAALFDLYDRLYALTDGALDPFVARDLELLGYDAGYPSNLPRRLSAGTNIDAGRGGLTFNATEPPSPRNAPRLLDVGAAGKGHLVDLVAETLIDAGVRSFVVDAGGDLRHHGDQPIRVGLEHPRDPTRVIGTIDLRNRALCASATNRRAWGQGLHHVLDARTGLPVADVLATWVIAEDAAPADGLATALFPPRKRLRQAYDFEFVRLRADGVETSPGFGGDLFF